VAIRPTDLQGSIIASVQSAQLAQRNEEGPRQAALAAQAQFANQLKQREESVSGATDVAGNRISSKGEREQQEFKDGKRRSPSGDPASETVDEDDAALGEPAHFIDVTA
jgi:hypothetical protein